MDDDVDAAEAMKDRLGHDRAAFGSGDIRRNERPAAIQLETVAHGRISSEAILSPSSTKMNRKSMGLPGKFPVSRFVTMISSPFRTDASGSTLCWYFFLVPEFHSLMAARP